MNITDLGDEELCWSFSKAELCALVRFACADKTRPNLCTVMLDGPNRRAAATDGHRLAICSAKNGATGKLSLVARADMERLAKMAKKTDVIEVRVNCEKVTMAIVNGPSFETKPVDVKFPPVDQLILREPGIPCDSVYLNSSFLADINLIGIATGCENQPVRVRGSSGQLEPFRFDAISEDGATRWAAVIMPVRPPFDEEVAT